MGKSGIAVLAALLISGCATVTGAPLGPPQQDEDIMSGGRFKEPWLSQIIKDAASHPLGSKENPVRSDMPAGERAYLMRLRCANGKAPTFARAGNMGAGTFGSIVDLYEVQCAGSSPATSEIVIDMYFPGYRETQAVPGFTITPP